MMDANDAFMRNEARANIHLNPIENKRFQWRAKRPRAKRHGQSRTGSPYNTIVKLECRFEKVIHQSPPLSHILIMVCLDKAMHTMI